MKKQAGFTLIELVMVIVILGILAAVALPKFVNLGSDARTAAMKGVEGAMRSANAMIYAKAAVANQMAATGSVTIPGASGNGIVLLNYGYAQDAFELKKAMDLSTDDFDFDVAGRMQIRHKGAQDPAYCAVTYTAADVNVAPTYSLRFDYC